MKMNSSKENIEEQSQKFSRNPIGIVALFIILIDGIAGTVLGVSSQSLDPYQKWFLIIFIIFFPITVFFTFVWLVVKHHEKLYGPSDFNDDEAFLRILTLSEQKLLLKNKEAQLFSENAHLNNEQKSNQVSCQAYKANDILSKIILYEDLALRQLEEDLGLSLSRHVSLYGIGEFSAALVEKRNIIAIDVKFIKQIKDATSLFSSISDILRNISKAKEYGYYSFILVIVSDGLSEDDMQVLTRRLLSLPTGNVFMKLQIYDLKILKRKFDIS